MVAVWEYRIPLPFTLKEYEIAQLYMVAKYSASESKGSDGDGVEVLKNEPYKEGNRQGQYTHKIYHLASKLPGWLVTLVPKKALMLEEEAWNSYPRCTTILKCPFFNKFRLVLETMHVEDCGTTENALDLDSKTLKKRQVEFIDIATDPVENYVEEEDPSKYHSAKTGRGPLLPGWQKKTKPLMCAYKLVTVDVPYWGFGSRLEKFISKTAQRKILLEGHRKCFCWMDEWHGLTMDDVRVMEAETAQAMRRARALALMKRGLNSGEWSLEDTTTTEDDRFAVPSAVRQDDEVPHLTPLKLRDLVPGSGKSSRSNSRNHSRELNPHYVRQPSLVGPSIAMGITTLSVSDMHRDGAVSSNPPPPPPPPASSSPLRSPLSVQTGQNLHFGSRGSFSAQAAASGDPVLPFGSSSPSRSHCNVKDEESDSDAAEVEKCVDVLDRAIAWAKARAKSKKLYVKQQGPQVHPVEASPQPRSV